MCPITEIVSTQVPRAVWKCFLPFCFILYVLYRVGLTVSAEAAPRLWRCCFYVWLQGRAAAVMGKEAAAGQQHLGAAVRHLSLSSSVAALSDPCLSPTGLPGTSCACACCHSHPGTSSAPQGWRKSFDKVSFPWGNPEMSFGCVPGS